MSLSRLDLSLGPSTPSNSRTQRVPPSWSWSDTTSSCLVVQAALLLVLAWVIWILQSVETKRRSLQRPSRRST
ncbi:hypothetical protein LZ32DRAFT_28497 [Colletotrichum eremochloae]|nr:hypothetical protein LZ32DRAFT_28497 [Colletotrichum eremochloae]